MAHFVQRNRFQIDRAIEGHVIRIILPREVRVVIDLSKSNIAFTVSVDIGHITVFIQPDKRKGDTEYETTASRCE